MKNTNNNKKTLQIRVFAGVMAALMAFGVIAATIMIFVN